MQPCWDASCTCWGAPVCASPMRTARHVLCTLPPTPCAARYRREEALSKAQAELDALERKRGELQRMLGRAAQD